MSTEAPAKPAEGQADQNQQDPVKNIKAEMDRKLSNLTKQLEEQARLMQQMAVQRQPEVPQASSKSTKIDPFADDFDQQIERMVESRLNNKINAQSRETQVINEMRNDYPELDRADSELSQKVLEIYKQYGENERGPLAIKAAIRDAAADLGLVPARKRARKEDSGEETLSSGSGSEGGGNSRRNSKKDEIDPKTEAFAALLDKATGRERTPEQRREALKKYAGRKTWNKYRDSKGEA